MFHKYAVGRNFNMNMLLNTYLDIHMSMEPHHTIDMTANMLSIDLTTIVLNHSHDS